MARNLAYTLIMKKFGALILFIALLSNQMAYAAQPVSGAPCKAIGKQEVQKSKLFTCVKSGKKLVWNSGLSISDADLTFNGTEMDYGNGINFSVSATRGDKCVVTLYVDSKVQDSQSFTVDKTGQLDSSFWTSPTGSTRLEVSCKFSGSDLEFIPSLPTPRASFTPRAAPTPTLTPRATPTPTLTPRATPTPTLTPSATPTPSVSISNPFADAASAAAKEAAEKKRVEEEKARLAAEEQERQRQKSISQAMSQLLENYCGRRTSCDVGKTGPGGGLIFFHAQQPQWWGTHLEVRTTGIQSNWCDKPTLALTKNVTDPKLLRSLGKELGKGKQNTQLMLAACSSGAANVANSFRGGGLDDWYLPSYKELDQICKFAAGTNIEEMHVCHRSSTSWNLWGYFPSIGEYWSSSEYTEKIQPEGNFAWFIQFFDGKSGPLDKKALRPVLAVRAYGPKD